MKRNKKKSYLMLLLLLVLGVTVGYAFLSTTLNINGTTVIKDAKWNVYWDNPVVTTGSVTTTVPTIDSAKTTATYDVTLNNPKDYYEFTIDAVNAGTIDAMIKVNGVSNKVYSDANRTTETTLPAAIKYTVTYADGTTIAEKHLLAKKQGNTPTRETYKVRVEYRNDEETTAADLEAITEETTYYMTFSVEYVQAENAIEAHPVSAITYITRQNEGQITPGDVIGIGETEDFYVISSNSEKTVLLAKYNLLVGYSHNESTNYEDTYITPSTPGYGLQSEDAIGYANDQYFSTVAFSSTNYWDDGNGLLSPYNANGASYGGTPKPFVYNSSLTTAPDFENDGWNTSGYSIAHYVDQYVTALKEMGAPSTITGRLLTFEEATSPSIGCDANEYTCPQDSFITDTSYWLGSACSYGRVWNVTSGGLFSDDDYDYGDRFGVRPVIEISTSDI